MCRGWGIDFADGFWRSRRAFHAEWLLLPGGAGRATLC
jgi:hypothetical protein